MFLVRQTFVLQPRHANKLIKSVRKPGAGLLLHKSMQLPLRGPWPSAWRIRPLDESSKTVRADLSVAWQRLPCSVWLKRQCCRTCELRERFYELTQHVERSCECAKARKHERHGGKKKIVMATNYGEDATWYHSVSPAWLARCSGRVYTCTRACSYRCARLRKADAIRVPFRSGIMERPVTRSQRRSIFRKEGSKELEREHTEILEITKEDTHFVCRFEAGSLTLRLPR